MSSVSTRILQWSSWKLRKLENAVIALNMSGKMSHIAERELRATYRAHEAEFKISQLLLEYDPGLDPAYLVRTFQSELSSYAEAKLRIPDVSREDVNKAQRLIVKTLWCRGNETLRRWLRL